LLGQKNSQRWVQLSQPFPGCSQTFSIFQILFTAASLPSETAVAELDIKTTALFYLVPRSSSFTPVLIAISLSSETVAELEDIKMTALFYLVPRSSSFTPVLIAMDPSLQSYHRRSRWGKTSCC
jgi:hypothetical protein